MSTEIKAGDTIVTVQDAPTLLGRTVPQGTYGTVKRSGPPIAGPYSVYAHFEDDAPGDGRQVRPGDVRVVPATPAPLDPRNTDHWGRQLDDSGNVARPLDPSGETTVEEITVGQPGDLREGDVVVQVPAWHTNADAGISGLIGDVVVRREKPAPEPEPEWTGRFVSAVIDVDTDGRRFERRNGFVSRSSGGEDALYLLGQSDYQTRRNMSEVEDVRPLVVIDPTTARKTVVDALATVLPDATVDYELLNAATDAVVAALGIRGVPDEPRPLPTRDQVIEAVEGHQFFADRVMALLTGGAR